MRWKLRLAAAFIVGTIAIVAAAVPEHITMGPPNIRVKIGPGSTAITAKNDGQNSIIVTGIDRDASCLMSTHGDGITAEFANFPSNMFTFAVGDQPVVMFCPSGGPSSAQKGIRRCEFFIKKDDTMTGRLADFSVICLYQTMPALSATPAPLMFGTVPVGGMQSATFSVSTSSATAGLYFSIVDGDNNYALTAPCVGVHCLDPVPLPSGALRLVTVNCTPTRSGNLDTVLHIVGDNGLHLATPLSLICSGAAPTTGGEINLSQEIVTRSQPVLAGPTSASVTLENATRRTLK